MQLSAQATLELFPGDVLITSDPNASFLWDESLPDDSELHELEDQPDEAVPADEPDLADGGSVSEAGTEAPASTTGEFVFQLQGRDSVSFQLSPTAEACFNAVKVIYATTGRAGLDAFFKRNGLARLARTNIGSEKIVANNGGSTSVTEKLLFRSKEVVEAIAGDAVREIERKAAGAAADRLARANDQIIEEFNRYFLKGSRRRDKKSATSFLATRVDGGILLNVERIDTLDLIREWKSLQPLVAEAREAAGLERQTRSAVLEEQGGMWALGDLTPSQEDAIYHSLIEEVPQLAELRKRNLDAREALARRMAEAAAQFPVLWRIAFSAPEPETMGQIIFDALKEAFTANQGLSEALAENSADAWKFPTLIHFTLDQDEVPPLSIAWTAIEERVRDEGGIRLTTALSLVSGFSRLGIAAGAALGVAAIAPPVAVAVVLADIFLNVADAAQEYRSYCLQNDAFRAALDPSMSLAADPSLFSAVLTISLDLLSVLG